MGKFECALTPKLIEAHGYTLGPISTGNSLDWNADDMANMESAGAVCKEMEAAAIGWACSLSKTPFFCVKSVTDIVDGDKPTHEEFLENLHLAAVELQKAVPAVLSHVAGRALEDM